MDTKASDRLKAIERLREITLETLRLGGHMATNQAHMTVPGQLPDGNPARLTITSTATRLFRTASSETEEALRQAFGMTPKLAKPEDIIDAECETLPVGTPSNSGGGTGGTPAPASPAPASY